MLRRWSLRNFKPIHDRVDLELGGVTVLAGLNSSGKSSVLQSILLISQTLANRILDRPLILNGHLVQLGTFNTLRNERADEKPIELEFELNFSEAKPKLIPHPLPVPRRMASRLGAILRAVTVSAQFTSGQIRANDPGNIDAVRASLTQAFISVEGDFELAARRERQYTPASTPNEPIITNHLTIAVHKLTEQTEQQYLQGVAENYLNRVPYPDGTNYLGTLYANTLPLYEDPQFLVKLTHFLPSEIIAKFNIRDRKISEMIRAVNILLTTESSAVRRSFQRTSFPAEIIEQTIPSDILQDVLSSIDTSVNFNDFIGTSIVHLSDWLWNQGLTRTNRQRIATRLTEAILDNQNRFHDTFQPDANWGLEHYRNALGVDIIDAVNEQTTAYFTSMIRYLGPLRADPRSAQGFSPSSEVDDVGPKGEYAAYVYDTNRQRRIQWWNPERQTVSTEPLRVAVDTWVRHLGVADRVSTQDAGLAGFSWMIRTRSNSQDRPLSAVGVGVSQVLPILVSGLLAPQGSILLFEQPELHLHARAQARLADFFVGLTRVGKQCLIETHSDCLVSQFRYHVVRNIAAGSEIMMYFAQQDRETGDSQFDRVQISPNGNIVNWPEGFFDESLIVEDRIATAAVQQRALRKD